jgi:hypothetical protein
MIKQRLIFTNIWQNKDLSLQKQGKAKIYHYKNMAKQRFILT